MGADDSGAIKALVDRYVGLGIDRLIMIFTHSHSIRDVLYFPWMKPL
jgi:elongation factor P--beta-lysine ligase